MKEIPILFSTPMVQAILKGHKTQTRRVISDPQTLECIRAGFDGVETLSSWKPGDLLWVRETWANVPETAYGAEYIYKASFDRTFSGWKPSIFMPKAAARIWLEVISVRAERLRDISAEDAIAEGVEHRPDRFADLYRDYSDPDPQAVVPTAFQSYGTLWRYIHGPDSWADNPWVWVIEFRVLSTTGKPLNT